MKTTLEWVSVDDSLPKEGTRVLIEIESLVLRSCIFAWIFEGRWKTQEFGIEFNKNGEIIEYRIHDNFKKYFLNKKILRWAYVNLPESEPKELEEKCICCIKCKMVVIKGNQVIETFSRQSEGIVCGNCEKCKEKEEREQDLHEKFLNKYKCYKCEKYMEIKHSIEDWFIEYYDEEKPPLDQNYICKKCKKVEEEIEDKKLSQQVFSDVKSWKEPKLGEESWIWPLKQLPNEGQRVEVKTLSNSIFTGCYLKNRNKGEFFIHPAFYWGEGEVNDVVAWRPLKAEKIQNKEIEEIEKKVEKVYYADFSHKMPTMPICPNCRKSFNRFYSMGLMSKSMYCDECTEGFQKEKPQDRKPDFSKLREGDLIVADYEGRKIVGFYRPFNEQSILMGFFKDGGGGITEKEKIKKIIRINIDDQSKVYAFITRPSDKYNPGEKLKAYPLEEI